MVNVFGCVKLILSEKTGSTSKDHRLFIRFGDLAVVFPESCHFLKWRGGDGARKGWKESDRLQTPGCQY